MLEQGIQSRIIKALSSRGVYVVKVVSASRNGTPDLLCCYKGRFIAIEVKRPGEKPSALQTAKLEEIRKAGGIAVWVDSLDAAISVFDAL